MQINEIVEKLHGPNGVVIKDRCYFLRKYHTCFVGSEAVDWFISSGFASNRAEAVDVGQSLLDIDLIHHVVDEHHFEDRGLFYRFRKDDPAHLVSSGPSAASLKSECGAKFYKCSRRGLVTSCTCFFALKPADDTMYEFKTELDSSPNKTYPLKDAKVKLDKSTGLILTFPNIQRSALRFSMNSEEDQLDWLKAFEKSGVLTGQTEEDCDDKVKSAKSIFEFEAVDIKGELVSLEKYRGFVTLIVNVASQ